MSFFAFFYLTKSVIYLDLGYYNYNTTVNAFEQLHFIHAFLTFYSQFAHCNHYTQSARSTPLTKFAQSTPLTKFAHSTHSTQFPQLPQFWNRNAHTFTYLPFALAPGLDSSHPSTVLVSSHLTAIHVISRILISSASLRLLLGY